METLRTHIAKMGLPNQLVDLNNLFDPTKAQTKITFWGTRVVEVKGYSRYISLSSLAKEVIMAGGLHTKFDNVRSRPFKEQFDFETAQYNFYQAGVELVGKLRNYYKLTDDQIKNSNFFTRFLNWFREFFFGSVHAFDYSYAQDGKFRGLDVKDMKQWTEKAQSLKAPALVSA
ncbi:MAG: hypothetical protein HZB76_05485 [Chlamydiae bacterium]|nr:hypothetical protein [Chlamydiota bacterium]